MNVLIVGGSGFIGGHLAEAMRERGDEVQIFDKKRHVWQDAHSVEELMKAMVGVDLVVHLAANADISKAATDPMVDFTEGTVLTQNVLEAMRLVGVRKIAYASGSGVYGEYRGKPFAEDDPLLPVSPYGASKVASEMLIRAYCAMFGFRADVFRFANVVGPRQTHGVGFDFMRKLRETREHLWVLGDGTQRKSYIHVYDVCTAIATALAVPRFGFDVYNVATADDMTVREIAHMAIRRVTDECEILYTGGDRGWKGDVPVLRMNTDKIRALGWEPRLDSASAMSDALVSMWTGE